MQAAFSRFLPVASIFHGQVINVSSLARDAESSRTTIDGYIQILEDTLVAQRLPALETKFRVREKKHPKLFWVDPGIARALQNAQGPVTDLQRGSLLEGFVFQMLKHALAKIGHDGHLAYWSPAEAKLTEVDFVCEAKKGRVAIEVKASPRLRPEHLRGLEAISEDKSVRRKVLVYLGERRLRTPGGVDVLPFGQFCEEIESIISS